MYYSILNLFIAKRIYLVRLFFLISNFLNIKKGLPCLKKVIRSAKPPDLKKEAEEIAGEKEYQDHFI